MIGKSCHQFPIEKSINIRASDYKFQDKKRYYNGYIDAKGKIHPASMIAEYRDLTQKDDFTEDDIMERDRRIHERFITYLEAEKLLKE